jgi:hypothetical protein
MAATGWNRRHEFAGVEGEIAKKCFTGSGANVSLDDIAR